MSSIALAIGSRVGVQSNSMVHGMLRAMATAFTATPQVWAGPDVALGVVPFLSLPEDRADAQPLWSADRRVCLVAHVRLDDRTALGNTLGLTGAATLPDAAYLLAAWQRWGPDLLSHITGSFAFIVWQPAENSIFAARDHTGECQLFFHQAPGLFAIASAVKGLLTLPGVGMSFNEQRIADWLALSHPAKDTSFFADITRLAPGSSVTIRNGVAQVRRYWDPFEAPPVRFRRDGDYADRLRELVDRATAERLRSRGAVSTQLSSGLDSATVTSSAALLLRRAGRDLTSYTAVPQPGFNDTHRNTNIFFDEGPYAAEVAALYPNIRHELVSSQGVSVLKSLQDWTDAMDEPVLNATNSVWIGLTLQLARANGSDVLLNGASGNMGMSYESLHFMSEFFRSGRWFKLWRMVRVHRGAGFLSYRQAAEHALRGLLPAILDRTERRMEANFTIDFAAANPDFAREYRMQEAIWQRYFEPAPDVRNDQRKSFERFDMGGLQTAARALAGVESRDPTQDKELWQFCLSIPPEQFVAEGHSRSLVRRAMRGRLPERTLNRYARGHQGADWYFNVRAALPALRQELEEQERSPAACRILDLPRLKRITETFPDSGFQTMKVFDHYHFALLRGIAMGYFLRTHDPALREISPALRETVPALRDIVPALRQEDPALHVGDPTPSVQTS